MYQLSYVPFDQIRFPPGVDKVGGFNDMPQPYRKITANRYIHLSHEHLPNYIVYRQIRLPEWKTYRSVYLEIYHRWVLARVLPDEWTLVDGEIEYTEPVLYYYIGCVHDFKELTPEQCRVKNIRHYGMSHHVYECSKCQMIDVNHSD
jgi:hypothetical protein